LYCQCQNPILIIIFYYFYSSSPQSIFQICKYIPKPENVEVYKLITEPAWVDEFAWEQFFFKCGNKVYVLSFYQEG